MSEAHPVRYLVQVQRNNIIVHAQEASTREEADALKAKFEAVPHSVAEIIEVHDPAETDLTTHTREIVEAIAERARE